MNRTEIKHWTADTAEEPTWRDGLNGTDRSYLIVAVPNVSRNGYQAIVFGRWGGGQGKLKFYPSPEALGIDRRSLMAMGISGLKDRSSGGIDSGYVRYMATLAQVKQLLEGLEPSMWTVCPVDQLQKALEGQLGRNTSRLRAPYDHDHPPKDAGPITDEGGLAGMAEAQAEAQAEDPSGGAVGSPEAWGANKVEEGKPADAAP